MKSIVLLLGLVTFCFSNDNLFKLRSMLAIDFAGVRLSGYKIKPGTDSLINVYNSVNPIEGGTDEIAVAESYKIVEEKSSNDSTTFTVRFYRVVPSIYDDVWKVKDSLDNDITFNKGVTKDVLPQHVSPQSLILHYSFLTQKEYAEFAELIKLKLQKCYKLKE